MKIKKIHKNGQEHIEVIISFVIFIGFLAFLFIFFNPFKAPKNEEIPRTVFLNLEEKLTTELSSISITLKNPNELTGKDCFKLSFDDDTFIKDLNCTTASGNHLIVKNQTEDIIEASIKSNDKEIKIKFSPENKLYTLYCSRDIIDTIFSLNGCQDLKKNENFSLGIISERNVWSTKKLGDFQAEYEIKYEEIKNELMPQGTNFAFSVNDETGAQIFYGNKIPPKGINIYSEVTPIDLMDDQAKIKKATISLIIW